MKFKSRQIEGKGRGRFLGYPTINLKIPQNFKLKDGIYGAKVFIDKGRYLGALFFGPIPTFDQKEKSLEIFLIDTTDIKVEGESQVEVETFKYIREVRNFKDQEGLKEQMRVDVLKIKDLFLKES